MDLVTLWVALFGTFLGCMIVYGLMSQQLLKLRQDADNRERENNLELMRFRNDMDDRVRKMNDYVNERFEICYKDSHERIRELEKTISNVWERIDKVQSRETLIHTLEALGEKKNIRDLVEKYV